MRLKKRTKRILKKGMIGCALLAITLPVFSSFFPQNQADPFMDPRLMKEMIKAQANQHDTEGGIPGENVEGTYQVVDVTGGNTLSVLWGDVQEEVQLIGIKPVETSKEQLRDLLLSDIVNLEFDTTERDENGTLLAYVYREDGLFINREMLEQGYAKLMEEPENQRYLPELREAEQAARAKSMGIWDPESKEEAHG